MLVKYVVRLVRTVCPLNTASGDRLFPTRNKACLRPVPNRSYHDSQNLVFTCQLACESLLPTEIIWVESFTRKVVYKAYYFCGVLSKDFFAVCSFLSEARPFVLPFIITTGQPYGNNTCSTLRRH